VAAAKMTMGKMLDDLKPLISAASSASVRPSPDIILVIVGVHA
jgi:hypothetical protein